jgi:hypothetical protein
MKIFETVSTQLFTDHPFEEFTSLVEEHLQKIQTTGGYSSDLYAALGSAIARRAIFATALMDDVFSLPNVLVVSSALNTDITLAALECLPHAWGLNDSIDAIKGIPKAYLALLHATKFPENRSVALFALAKALDRQFSYVSEARSDENCLQVDRSFEFDTEGLRYLMEHRRGSTPSLANARIRISGCLLLSEYVSQRGIDLHMQRYRSHLEIWGQTLCSAGDAKNVR